MQHVQLVIIIGILGTLRAAPIGPVTTATTATTSRTDSGTDSGASPNANANSTPLPGSFMNVCKNDEWSYLCDSSSWAGISASTNGGRALQDLAYDRAMNAHRTKSKCDTSDEPCQSALEKLEAFRLESPETGPGGALPNTHEKAGALHPGNIMFMKVTEGSENCGVKDVDALYLGAYVKLESKLPNQVDEMSLIKFVAATEANGCDGAASEREFLYGTHVCVRMPW